LRKILLASALLFDGEDNQSQKSVQGLKRNMEERVMNTKSKSLKKAAWAAVLTALLWGGLVIAASAPSAGITANDREAQSGQIMQGDSVSP
jgi:hypothetical protein